MLEQKIEQVTETSGYGPSQVADLDLGKKILDVLTELYPLHAWFVDVNHEAGVATIQLMYEGEDTKVRIWKFGYLLHIKNIEVAEERQKRVMRAGGEILERYGLARGRAHANTMAEFRAHGIDAGSMVR